MDLLIDFFNNINVELFTVFNGFIAVLFMMIMMKVGGLSGLQSYVYLALVVANIQVLKGTNFIFINEPVPLGTLVYGTISIAISIIVEFYGRKTANKTILMGTIFMSGFTALILVTLGYKPLNEGCFSPELGFLYKNHFLMKELFMPIPAILISGLLAYFISEKALVYFQIFFQKFISSIFIRTYISNIIAAFVDLFVMNFLCWIVLNPNPITMKQLFISYIIASYPFRLLTAAVALPVLKIARHINKKNTTIE